MVSTTPTHRGLVLATRPVRIPFSFTVRYEPLLAKSYSNVSGSVALLGVTTIFSNRFTVPPTFTSMRGTEISVTGINGKDKGFDGTPPIVSSPPLTVTVCENVYSESLHLRAN